MKPPARQRCHTWMLLVVLGLSSCTLTLHARAQSTPPVGDTPPAADAPAGSEEVLGTRAPDTPASSLSEATSDTANRSLLDRVRATFSQDEDPDGPINTDRPTFTPANTVVPRGRLQFESGFTVNIEPSGRTRNELYDYPELAMRYGFMSRAEFRMLWSGFTDDDTQSPARRPRRVPGGAGDTEVGFKWQLLVEDKQRRWRPTTALITSIIAPTGGSSRLSDETVEPYINLIYGWGLTDKLTLAGSTGYLGIRQQPPPGTIGRTDNLQRYHQSLVAFYSVGERTTLFYEWYVWMFTNAPNNLPTHFMDGGVLYRLTPNTQLDLRAGFGLSGRPDDFFTGAGFSIRF